MTTGSNIWTVNVVEGKKDSLKQVKMRDLEMLPLTYRNQRVPTTSGEFKQEIKGVAGAGNCPGQELSFRIQTRQQAAIGDEHQQEAIGDAASASSGGVLMRWTYKGILHQHMGWCFGWATDVEQWFQRNIVYQLDKHWDT